MGIIIDTEVFGVLTIIFSSNNLIRLWNILIFFRAVKDKNIANVAL